MQNKDLLTSGWSDYELLDSGDNKKLERYEKFVIIRPETQAIWKPQRPELWKKADAEFRFEGSKGSWRGKNAPEPWNIAWNDEVRFSLRLTSFKHTGVFPEQAPNWEWTADCVKQLKKSAGARVEQPPKILNLFGYTGVASIVAARHGAQVTHCDASKQSNAWARDNATLSNIPANAPDNGIRYITDDALKFVERELRRGATYDGIILDPPAFGRGANGEVWHIEDDIIVLLDALRKLIVKKPGSFFLLNGYAAGYASQSFLQSVESSFPEAKTASGEFGELRIKESSSERVIPAGIYVRFVL